MKRCVCELHLRTRACVRLICCELSRPEVASVQPEASDSSSNISSPRPYGALARPS